MSGKQERVLRYVCTLCTAEGKKRKFVSLKAVMTHSAMRHGGKRLLYRIEKKDPLTCPYDHCGELATTPLQFGDVVTMYCRPHQLLVSSFLDSLKKQQVGPIRRPSA